MIVNKKQAKEYVDRVIRHHELQGLELNTIIVSNANKHFVRQALKDYPEYDFKLLTREDAIQAHQG